MNKVCQMSFPYPTHSLEFFVTAEERYNVIHARIDKIECNEDKTCTRCKKEHPKTHFINVKSGKETKQCISCRQKVRMFNQRQERKVLQMAQVHYRNIKNRYHECHHCHKELHFQDEFELFPTRSDLKPLRRYRWKRSMDEKSKWYISLCHRCSIFKKEYVSSISLMENEIMD